MKRGALYLVSDVDLVRKYAQDQFGPLPHVLLGHSMGSFVVRVYLQNYAQGLHGAIIMGTGWHNHRLMDFTKALSLNLVKAHGEDYRSKLLDALVLGAYAAKFPGEGKSAWLSHNLESRKAYKSDERTQFRFSAASYHELLYWCSVHVGSHLLRLCQKIFPFLLHPAHVIALAIFQRVPKVV